MAIHRVSIIQPAAEVTARRLAATPGVTDLTYANWFGGNYQDTANFITNFAVEPESWLPMYPEYQLPEEQKQAWFRTEAAPSSHRHAGSTAGKSAIACP